MKKIIAFIVCAVLLLSLPVSAQAAPRIVDSDDLLTEEQETVLIQKTDELYNKYNFEIVILTFDDLEYKDIKTFTADYFMDNGYGTGENRDGLILSVYDGKNRDVREFCSAGHGYGRTATGEYFYECLFDESAVVKKLSDSSFYEAFTEYLELADKFLAAYAAGSPYGSYSNGYKDPGVWNTGFSAKQLAIGFAVIIAVSALGAFIYVSVLKYKMNTARAAGAAHNYIRPDSFKLTRSRDFFIYSTVSKVKIETESNSSSGGGSFKSSGGSSFSGGSSRF